MTSLEEIKRLLAAATPGPWEWYDDDAADDGGAQKADYWTLGPGVLIAEGTDGTPDGDEIDRANAQLIAKAPTVIAELIEQVERLQKVADAAERYQRAMRGFAEAVRQDTGKPYPWEPGDIADEALRQALEESK